MPASATFSVITPMQRVLVLGCVNRLCAVILDSLRSAGERITASGYLAELEQEIAEDAPLMGWALDINARPSEDILPLIRNWIDGHSVR